MRKDYHLGKLTEDEVAASPLDQFQHWFDDAVKAGLPEPNAMVLATVNEHRQPTARAILLKQFDARGFVFFSNYLSRKGQELWDNPKAALLAVWLELERQIRIEGEVTRIDARESDEYFESRPHEAKIAAIASPQSKIIASRRELEALYQAVEANKKIARPESWGGFRLRPHYFEFWQGRENRLHDRVAYELVNGEWPRKRLAP